MINSFDVRVEEHAGTEVWIGYGIWDKPVLTINNTNATEEYYSKIAPR